MRQRETEHERGRGRERGRHRIGSRLQALSHQPRAWRGARTHRARDRDLAEVGRLTDCVTQAPQSLSEFNVSELPVFTSQKLDLQFWLLHIVCLFNVKIFLFYLQNWSLKFFLTFIYYWETKRDRTWSGEGQREEETESKAGSRLPAVTRGSNSQTVRSWPELKLDA